ncbi:MAG: hypothetical protein FJ271_02040 [Planctomycetes bacterium]|nr:hypothetical protein [Planctomycetota bacterium]
MPTEISCSRCGHRVTVVDGQRIICPNCKETEAVKALFAAPAPPPEVHAFEHDGRPQITFVCPFCSEVYPVSEDLAGKKINCRNCYEASRAPGKEKKPKPETEPPAPAPVPGEPWFSSYADHFANIGMIVGGGACLAGTTIALSFVKGKEILAPLSIALGFVAAFFLVVGGMLTLRIVVDALRKRPDQERK